MWKSSAKRSRSFVADAILKVGVKSVSDVGKAVQNFRLVHANEGVSFVTILGKEQVYKTRTVDLVISAPDTAAMMKLSQDGSFTENDWEPVVSNKEFTFDDFGINNIFWKMFIILF